MRCVYACPQQAIVSRGFGFCVLKDGYDIQAIIANADLEGNFISEETRGFYRHFLRYIRNADV
jgi:hypothetical protein